MKTICKECGSDNVSTLQWINPNTGEVTGSSPEGDASNWCEECCEHTKLTTEL